MAGDTTLVYFSGELTITLLREDLKKVTKDRIKLYTKDLPPEKILILVAPFDIEDAVLEEEEITIAIRKLKIEN